MVPLCGCATASSMLSSASSNLAEAGAQVVASDREWSRSPAGVFAAGWNTVMLLVRRLMMPKLLPWPTGQVMGRRACPATLHLVHDVQRVAHFAVHLVHER